MLDNPVVPWFFTVVEMVKRLFFVPFAGALRFVITRSGPLAPGVGVGVGTLVGVGVGAVVGVGVGPAVGVGVGVPITPGLKDAPITAQNPLLFVKFVA